MSHFPSDSYRRGAANRDPEEEALGWVVRLTSGSVTDADRHEFEHWHADSANACAYGRARRLWAGLGPVLEKGESAGWPGAEPAGTAPVEKRDAPSRRFRHAATAALLAVVAMSGVQYSRIWRHDHVSGTAIIDTAMLADGTRVTLGPNTAFDSRFGNGVRQVSLVRGEVFFDVRRDVAHPFVIAAGNGIVRVLGTAFSVRRRDDDSVIVTVTRGKVEVTSGARNAILTPDRQVTFSPAGLQKVHAVEASLVTAWTRGRLILEDRPLADVLAEVDRYRGGKTFLLNSEAGQRRVNAVIDLGDVDSWLGALASSQGLRRNTIGSITVLR